MCVGILPPLKLRVIQLRLEVSSLRVKKENQVVDLCVCNNCMKTYVTQFLYLRFIVKNFKTQSCDMDRIVARPKFASRTSRFIEPSPGEPHVNVINGIRCRVLPLTRQCAYSRKKTKTNGNVDSDAYVYLAAVIPLYYATVVWK